MKQGFESARVRRRLRFVLGAALHGDWLPLLFWIVPSIVTWGAVKNLLENTQALFTSTAILLMLAPSARQTPEAMPPW